MSANSFEDNAALIVSTFNTGWIAAFASSAAPVVIYPDSDDVTKHIPVVGKYAFTFYVRENATMPISCGAIPNRRYRVLGNAIMQLLVSIGDARTPRQYCDIVAAIFRGSRVNGNGCSVSFDSPNIKVFGVENQHRRAVWNCPFRYDFIG